MPRGGCIRATGMLRPSGALKYQIKDMLRVGGENLAPAEVEEVLCQHPKVRQAAVVGIPDERLVEVPAAVLELKPGEQCTVEEIVAFELAAYCSRAWRIRRNPADDRQRKDPEVPLAPGRVSTSVAAGGREARGAFPATWRIDANWIERSRDGVAHLILNRPGKRNAIFGKPVCTIA